MSGICIFNLKQDRLNFSNMNDLAKKLIKYALKENIAVFFNCYDYGQKLISEAKMKKFILVSDSFLYRNCDLFNVSEIANLSDVKKFYNSFKKKFTLLESIVDVIFKYNIKIVELYMSYNVDAQIDEFSIKRCSRKTFIKDLFEFLMTNADKYAYTLPPIKLEIQR